MPRLLRKKDIDKLEQEIPKNDRTAERIGRSYSRAQIARLEEQKVPWLRRRSR